MLGAALGRVHLFDPRFNFWGCVEDARSVFATNKTVRILSVVSKSTRLAEGMPTRHRDWIAEEGFTNATNYGILTIFVTGAGNLIVAFIAVFGGLLVNQPSLFLLEGLFILKIELMARLVITSVVEEYTSVSESTVTVLVVVLASFGVVINSGSHSNI